MDIVKQLRKQNIGGSFPDDYVSYAAADEIERLREALRLIAAPSKVIAKNEDMAAILQLLLTSHRQTALKALGEKE